jgi:hypothetical protein
LQKKDACEKIIEDYLSLDRGEAVPLKLWTHLLFCKDCRTEVRFLNLADTACTKPLKIERKKEESLAKTIISRIQNDPECKEIFVPKELTLKNWIISGLIMLFAMLFFYNQYLFAKLTNRPSRLSCFCGIYIWLLCSFCRKQYGFFYKKAP